jgi:hypothetical protein
MPYSKRGVPNDVTRSDLEKWAALDDWHIIDAEICSIIDAEASTYPENLGLGVWWWAVLCDAGNPFSHPVKHFGKGGI